MKSDYQIIEAEGASLFEQVQFLFAQQRSSWDALKHGEQALSQMVSKSYQLDQSRVIVVANPLRKRSIHAKVDAASVAGRKCFLCAHNMPAQERAIAFADYVIVPNPYPICAMHMTIPSLRHEQQEFSGRIHSMLDLAKGLGPQMIVFYNGPRCGASAPDHFHFQACQNQVPLFEEVCTRSGQTGVFVLPGFGRNFLICRAQQKKQVCEFTERVFSWLRLENQEPQEPLVNILATYRDEMFCCVMFPRAIHRPGCYFAPAKQRISVSPAALEMAGLLVVADPDHFKRIDLALVRSIYSEVTCSDRRFAKLVEEMT